MNENVASGDRVIEVNRRGGRVVRYSILALLAFIFLFGSQLLTVYIDALWFSSLGFSEVYWYRFRLGGVLFVIFFVATFLILRLPFIWLNRALPQLSERPKLKIVSVEDLREVNFLPLIYRPGIWVLSLVVAGGYALSMAQHWSDFALFFNSEPSGVTEPILNQDVSFYLFTLPTLNLVVSWAVAITFLLFAVIAGIAWYLWYIEKVQGFGSTHTARRGAVVASIAGIPLALALALSVYIGRFDLLQTPHRLFTGVGYADANVRLPGLLVLVGVLVVAAALLAMNAFSMKRAKVIGWVAGAVILTWATVVLIVPQAVQTLSVNPNELAKEFEYIQHNIDMTRKAFRLDRFEERPFQPSPTLTAEKIIERSEALSNIRLWDPQALQSTFSQIQEIRTYYEFRVPDVDRYIIDGRLRQVMIAARELNVAKLPAQSRNWINQHLVYTHGYGVAMATVNEFSPEGLPHLILKDMPVVSDVPDLTVTRPEIYFGKVTNQHVYVKTRPQGTTHPEFNYPAPDNTDSYSEYEGDAGIPVGGLFRQLAFAIYLGDGTNLLLSDYITRDSRVLMRRNVKERASRVAPFLMYETDPYVVITREGRLVWILDAFTYSNRYPYSSGSSIGGTPVNYVRNSVKIVVDAYDGDLKFYVFESEDPMIGAYQRIFPALFVSADQMPPDIREHVRYPDMLVEVQARAYMLYHTLNPQTFYNREDMWNFALIEAARQEPREPEPMLPYYVLMELPGVEPRTLEFVSIMPFTPTGPGRNNMIGWLAARSDGASYGQTLVFSFPKNITVTGPAQIRARVNQDANLSAQLTLWNQMGSRVLRGNLQVIPLADSLLYIEPFYLQAVNSPLPELRTVAVATMDRLGIGRTFDEALNSLFPGIGEGTATTAIASAPPEPRPPESAADEPVQPAAQSPPARGSGEDLDARRRQWHQLLVEYERLTAEGRYREAGEKLEQLKQGLSNNNRRGGE